KPAATRARAARAPATQAEPTPEPADEDAPAEPADEDSPADEDNDWDLSPLPRTSTLPRAAGRRSARSPLRASRYSLRSLALTRRPLHPVSPHPPGGTPWQRSEEHTSELQSRFDLVCRLLLEKKKTKANK